jgi:hypothetical protein
MEWRSLKIMKTSPSLSDKKDSVKSVNPDVAETRE